MRQIFAVARNTFTESIRDRVLYSLIFFALIMIASSLVLSTISAEQYNKIVKDFGLTAISIFGVMLSIFLGIGLVYKEIEKKTVTTYFQSPCRDINLLSGSTWALH